MTMMTAITATPALALLPVTRAAAKSVDRTEWDRAWKAFKHAERQSRRLSGRYNLVEGKYFEELEKIPHIVVRPDFYTGRLDPVSTRDKVMVEHARRLLRELAEGRRYHEPDTPGLDEHTQFCRDLVAAADERAAQIKALDDRLGYAEAENVADAAVDKMSDAQTVLMQTPAPDGEALLWKLNHTFFEDHIWEDDYVELAISEARQLLGAMTH